MAFFGPTFLIEPGSAPDNFPNPRRAPADRPLAVGGDLAPDRLIHAYRHGIFPWYSDGEPIMWWSPDPRTVVVPSELRISRRLHRRMRRGEFEVTVNEAFEEVVRGCAAPRRGGAHETWITPAMHAAYVELHRAGHALSVECWRDGELAGGLYGIVVGMVFAGESMFSRVSDASKVALATVCAGGYALIDCQVPNDHLLRLGARLIPRDEFLSILAHCAHRPVPVPKSPGSRQGSRLSCQSEG